MGWTGAERSLIRALELNPQHGEAMLIYGRLLEAVGQLERGLAMKQQALERDPCSPLVHVQIAQSYWISAATMMRSFGRTRRW
jgi:tetratricopeptide (TPR) repeat protein